MKLKNILENFILVAIVLVIIQTFLDELSRYGHWSILTRNILLFSGLFFDLLFSIEFLVRGIFSGSKKGLYRYVFYERGWVDFLSSFPLLFLDSGPSVFLFIFGGTLEAGSAIGVMNVLKVVKAVRVTRILRLVRIIKIFGKIHNAESKMAQHHTSSIATTAVFTIVCSLIAFALFTDSSGAKKIEARGVYYNNIIKTIEKDVKITNFSSRKFIHNLFSKDKNVLKLYYKKNILLTKISDEELKKYYEREDYLIIENSNFSLYISIVDIYKDLALNHIESFIIIVLTVLSFMFIYTRHFVQNISDMTHILNKGFRKKDYNLQIKIREEYSEQEIFRLARFYNDAFLPAKLKRIQSREEDKSSGLSMKDFTDFNK